MRLQANYPFWRQAKKVNTYYMLPNGSCEPKPDCGSVSPKSIEAQVLSNINNNNHKNIYWNSVILSSGILSNYQSINQYSVFPPTSMPYGFQPGTQPDWISALMILSSHNTNNAKFITFSYNSYRDSAGLHDIKANIMKLQTLHCQDCSLGLPRRIALLLKFM